MEKLIRVLNGLSEWTGRGIAWFTLLMVVITFLVVILRSMFNVGWIAMQESVTILHALTFLLGAAYTLKHDGHVRVDIFYHRMSQRNRALVDMFGTFFLLLPVCLFILFMSWDYVATSWSYQERSTESNLAWVYLLKTTMLIMPLLLILQGFASFLTSLLIYLGRLAPTNEPERQEAG
ncbi:MAG: TRAP transporter small permease subunit [Pseudomonadota bacterium]|nr:TRAP transporter small permease subunit [Pseudomonadota bacterium]